MMEVMVNFDECGVYDMPFCLLFDKVLLLEEISYGTEMIVFDGWSMDFSSFSFSQLAYEKLWLG